MQIIWIDLPLILLSLFFLLLSFLYGWGMLYLFGSNFRWSLASVVGIASVVSMTYTFVWQVRGIELLPLQAVWDLALMFIFALPGMTWHDYKLITIEEKEDRAIKTYIGRLLDYIQEQESEKV